MFISVFLDARTVQFRLDKANEAKAVSLVKFLLFHYKAICYGDLPSDGNHPSGCLQISLHTAKDRKAEELQEILAHFVRVKYLGEQQAQLIVKELERIIASGYIGFSLSGEGAFLKDPAYGGYRTRSGVSLWSPECLPHDTYRCFNLAANDTLLPSGEFGASKKLEGNELVKATKLNMTHLVQVSVISNKASTMDLYTFPGGGFPFFAYDLENNDLPKVNELFDQFSKIGLINQKLVLLTNSDDYTREYHSFITSKGGDLLAAALELNERYPNLSWQISLGPMTLQMSQVARNVLFHLVLTHPSRKQHVHALFETPHKFDTMEQQVTDNLLKQLQHMFKLSSYAYYPKKNIAYLCDRFTSETAEPILRTLTNAGLLATLRKLSVTGLPVILLENISQQSLRNVVNIIQQDQAAATTTETLISEFEKASLA